MKFKVGDRVRGINRYSLYGEGTIIIIKSFNSVGIRFDNYNSIFHELSGLCENHHGYWCYLDVDIELTSPSNNILILMI
jgi:hypothetical protein